MKLKIIWNNQFSFQIGNDLPKIDTKGYHWYNTSLESTLLWKTEEEKHIYLIFFMENVIEFETLCLHDKFWGLITTFWTKFGIQYAPSPAKLQIKLFLFKSHSRSWPFQGIPVSHSHSQNSHFCSCYQISGMRFLIPVPIPKSWGCNFSFPFPLPKFGNGLSYSRSHSQNPKSHFRSPKCCQKCRKLP